MYHALQDTEQTEDILERLRTGRSTRWKGRDRVVSCLDEDDDPVNSRDSQSLDKNSLSSQAGADEPPAEEDLIEEPSISLRQRMRSQDLEMDCLLDEYEDTEDIGRGEPVVEDEIIEDDEEHEQSIIRQRMLEESVSVTCPISNSISTVIVLKCDEKDTIRFGIFWFPVLTASGLATGGATCFFVTCRR